MTVVSPCLLATSGSTSKNAKTSTPAAVHGSGEYSCERKKSPTKHDSSSGPSNTVLKKAESEIKKRNTPPVKKTPGFGGRSKKKSPKSKQPSINVTTNREPAETEKNPTISSGFSSENEAEVSFEDYSQLCKRVAKTMYYAHPKPPTTPRPSLPLTILAVETFSKYARKDTLEFLDIDMAADIGRQACVSPTALIFAMVYLERLSVNNPGYLHAVKPSELFVVSLLVASKFVQDDDEDLGIFNDEWATSANMELKRINQLEIEFLMAIDWKVNIGREEYEKSLQCMEEKMALYQGNKRGWFTYTELNSLANTQLSAHIILPILTQKITEVLSAICVMYTTLFATLVTSSALTPYIFSLSKLVLNSAGSHSLLVESSLSSCMQDISLQNSSIHINQDIGRDSTLPATNIHRLAPSSQWLPLREDQENNTEQTDILFSERLKQQLNNALHEYKRSYETANENYGYSFKCESNCRRHYSDDESIANVQRILENLLRSSTLVNANTGRERSHIINHRQVPCLDKSGCFQSSLLHLQSRPVVRAA